MEYRFRGWDAVGYKGWVYGDLVHNKRVDLTDRVMVGGYEVVLESVGLWTGLKDKNGKEIFEGDVVRRKDSAYGMEDIGVVKYDCRMGAFVLEYESYGRTYKSTFKKGFSDNDGKCTIEGTYSYELLGNIYDNPELLDKKE